MIGFYLVFYVLLLFRVCANETLNLLNRQRALTEFNSNPYI